MRLYAAAPTTQLREYYDALGAMKEQELAALADAHADDPRLLVRRFVKSIEAVGQRLPADEKFYDSRSSSDAVEAVVPDGITSTVHFAHHVRVSGACRVEGAEALGFRYIDREISPARTKGGARSKRRSLDLLLANSSDDLPVLAELKIKNDKPTYFALIQLLMLASELQTDAQRQRLVAHPGGKAFRWPEGGPYVDLYIIGFEPNEDGTYRKSSFDATEAISEKLLRSAAFSRHVRRIAYLEAALVAGALTFEKRFAYGPGV